MSDDFRNRGFTPEYLEYCRENGFENDPQGMLVRDKIKYPPNARGNKSFGSATGFME